MVTQLPVEVDPLTKLHPYVDAVLSTFGHERIIFGSDWPVCPLAAGYEETVEPAERLVEHLPVAQQRAIFGTNAMTWYGIGRK